MALQRIAQPYWSANFETLQIILISARIREECPKHFSLGYGFYLETARSGSRPVRTRSSSEGGSYQLWSATILTYSGRRALRLRRTYQILIMVAISFLPVGAGLALNWARLLRHIGGPFPWFPYCHDVGARALLSCDPGKRPTAAELDAVSEKQSKWLAMSSDQKSKTEYELRANLCGAWLTIEDSSDSSGFAVNGGTVSNLNLSEADLSRSQITITRSRTSHSIEYPSLNLSKTNLYCAKLAGQKLVAINLTGANLSYADLRGVVLQDSDLKDARFEDADLTDVNFGPKRLMRRHSPQRETGFP